MNPKTAIVKAAGLTYVIIIVIGVLNSIFIDARLIIYEDISLTINNILTNEFLFRSGNAWVLIMYVSVILISVLLYLILKDVNKNLALLAMVFRISEALLGITTVFISFFILGLLNNQFNVKAIENTQLNILVAALLDLRTIGLYIVLLLVGLGGTIFFYLFYKSFYIPKVLSIWGMLTYLSMIILSFIGLLFPEHPEIIEMVLYGLGTLFELTIGFWLLIKGVNIQ
ncbi:MAG: DUF4386 domain-containing protein [Ignavibacteriaceae bacterium]|nr:DUF4386 domain-containing protein [Ignavibacteriaceae bacterium]